MKNENRVLNEIKKYRGIVANISCVYFASDDIVHVGLQKPLWMHQCIHECFRFKISDPSHKNFLQNARAKNKQWDTFNYNYQGGGTIVHDKEISVAKKIAKENIKNVKEKNLFRIYDIVKTVREFSEI